ncbi:Blue-light-activated histidine kinase [Poriferisphaera corsica]|uniref:histidine kinase n=1 Tax=Poriferisphaera corsica TaxID=2528020 RepID=A0A517YZF8_9BACT|nr:transporter substrate-binding domain-containing protein [Poriferisphaera corsica]QDU35591.1 Blue-light-activated histidine kinase [Poriferisphaera corsica]
MFRYRAIWVMVVSIAAVVLLCHGAVFGEEEVETRPVVLTAEQEAWIRDHPVIRIGCAPDWPPFIFFNDRGEEVGIGRDYIDRISEVTGLNFEHVFYDTWSEVLEAAKAREIDVISTINENPQRARYLLFTDSYFTVQVVIIGTSEMREDLRLEDLKGRRIASVRGSAISDYLRSRYPELEIIGVIDDKSGLEGVAFHKYDVFVGDLASSSYYIDELVLPKLRVVGRTPLEYNIRIGSRRDLRTLNVILNKGLNAISDADRDDIERKWVNLQTEGYYIWPQLLLIVVGVIVGLIIVVVAVLMWNRLLRQKVQARTEELRRELEEHKLTEIALRESEEHFRRYFELGIVGMAMTDGEGRFLEVNDELCRMTGYTAEQLKQTSWTAITYPDDLKDSIRAFSKIVDGHMDGITIDKRYTCRDGRVIYAITSVRALRRADGVLSQTIALIQDITERKRTEIRQKTMMQELDHRVKNNLAEVLALAEHTLNRSTSLEVFRESFLSRVRAMAKTHEALAASKWEGVDLHKLVGLVLGAHCREGAERIEILGDHLVLPSRTCSPLCMTLNELSANAAKYGALSNYDGRIKLEWWFDEKKSLLRIRWTEIGGPEVSAPTKMGLGTKLMRGLIEYELQGKLEIIYPVEGLVCNITIKLIHDHLTAKH